MYGSTLDKIPKSNSLLGGDNLKGPSNFGTSIWFTVIVIICILTLFGLVLWLIFKPSLVKSAGVQGTSNANPTFQTIKVNGTSTLLGDVIMGNSIKSLYGDGVKGTNSLIVNYDETINGSSIINGSSTINGVITAESLYLGTDAYINGNGYVTGNMSIVGNLGVTGAAVFYDDLTIEGNLVTYGSQIISGNFGISGNLGVTGNTNIGGDLGVTGSAYIYGDGNIQGNLGVTGDAYIYGDGNIQGNLGVTGSFDVKGNATIKGNLGVTGNVIVNGKQSISGGLDVGQQLRAHNTTASLNQLTDMDIVNSSFAVMGGVHSNASGISIQSKGGPNSNIDFSDYNNSSTKALEINFPSKISTFYGDVRVDNLSNIYTISVPVGPGEITDNLKIASKTSTIMNAKPNGNQVHFMNGSTTPFLLIGNTGPNPGATGSRVYDELYNPPPGLSSDPSFNTVTTSGLGSFGTLKFGAPKTVNITYFKYIFSTYTYNFVGGIFPNGTKADYWGGTESTNSSQIVTVGSGNGNAWNCPSSGLWYITATLLAGNSGDNNGKFCTVGNLTTSTPFAISNEVAVNGSFPNVGFSSNVMNVNLITPIEIDEKIIVSSLTGDSDTAFYPQFSSGIAFVSSISFQLIAGFN